MAPKLVDKHVVSETPTFPESPVSQTNLKDHHGEHSDTPTKLSRSTAIFAMCAALNSCNLGYDVGVSTHVGGLVQDDLGLDDVQREIFLGSINMWSILGSLCAHWICDRYGRRRSFVVAAIGFIIGVVIMSMANSFTVLMIGRISVGLGVGFGLAIDPLYIAEVSPASCRGELIAWSEVALDIGIVFGFLSGLFFYNLPPGIEWRVMLLCGAIMPVVMIILVHTVMPESPRWLVDKGREEEAKSILQQIYPPDSNVDPVVADIKEAIEREKAADQAVGWKMIFFPTPAIRRILLVGIGVTCFQQAVGIDAIQYYLVKVLKDAGIDNDLQRIGAVVLLGLLKLVFVFVGGTLFDKKGRRPLFFMSLIGMIFSLLLVSFSFIGSEEGHPVVVVFGLGLYLAFFSSAMGPGGWLIPSEIFVTSIRAKAMSLSTFFNRIVATIMASTFLSVQKVIGSSNCFLLLAGICLAALIFIYYLLPETKGRSLEEMAMYFAEITGDETLLNSEKISRDNKKANNAEMAVHSETPLLKSNHEAYS